MVSVLDVRSSSVSLSPGQGHCVVFLGKTLSSQSASLHLELTCTNGYCDGLSILCLNGGGGSRNISSGFML